MKTNKLLIVLSSLTLAASVFVGLNLKKDHILAKADIDINDYTACETAHKAKNVSGLLSALRNITSPGHVGSYDGLYETYKVAYLKPNGKIFDYYSAITDYDPDKDRAGTYNKEGDCFNREHSIPQSWWGGGTGNQGSDPFIVVPTDGYVNNIRSSNPFGMVSNAKKTFSNSKSGTPDSSWGYTSTDVFEPDDSVKGDFARIYFYAIARYSAASGWSSNNAKSCFSGSDNVNTGLTLYAVKLFSYWSELDPVSDWELNVNNAIAPIQKNRNPFIDHPEYANTLWGNVSGYTEYTHGTPSLDGITISKSSTFLISGNSTTISAASSNGSTIHWSTSNSSVASISSSTSSSGANITIYAGVEGTATITATATIDGVDYSDTCEVEVSATKKPTSIEIQDPKVKYTVDESFVKPTVIASYNDGSSENVTSSASFTGYDLSQPGVQTVTVSYSFGGVTKTATYQITVKNSGGSGEIVTAEIDFTGNKTSDEDDNGYIWSVQGSHVAGSDYLRLTSSDSYISNNPAIPMDTTEKVDITASLRTYGGTSGRSFKIGAYDGNGNLISNILTLTPTDSTLRDYSGSLTFTTVEATDVVIKAYCGSNNSIGISGMSVQYKESSSQIRTLSSIGISTSPTKLTYEVGECFNPNGLTISRYYSDETSDTYTYAGHTSEFTFVPSLSTPLSVDDDSVEIIYGGESCFLEIEVTAPVELVSIEINGYQTTFAEGDSFVFGGTVIAHYADDSEVDVTSLASFSDVDMTILGNQQVTVSFKDKQQTYSITVSAGILSSISVSGMTTVYVRNAAFSFDGVCTATFENGYQKVVVPTSISSPDMTTTGVKQVTVSYTYGSIDKSTSYEITINSYRVVMEASEVDATLTWNSDKTPVINPSNLGLSSTLANNTYYESSDSAIRLGTGSGGGTINISSSSSVVKKIIINAKYYGSYSSSVLLCKGNSVGTLTSSFKNYEVDINSSANFSILTENKNNRVVVKYITIVLEGEEVDIGQTPDCIGLETFITNYMHMDYTENLGYCSDSEHHYYATAKEEFNKLNDHQRSLFVNNEAYLAEWTRLSAWASKNNDSLNNNNLLVLSRFSESLDGLQDYSVLIMVLAISSISSILLVTLLILKKRKYQK